MQKLPFCSAEKLHEIAALYPTPFHLYDERGIRETARRVQAAFSWNAGFREHFAVKANPNPYILSVLKSEGCGVDCASITELMLAKAVGFEGEEIMFSSNMTPAEDYVYARKLGAIINLDDITHIEFLKKNGRHPGKDLPALQSRRRIAHWQHLHGASLGRQIRHDAPADFPGHPHAAKRGRQAVRPAHALGQQFHRCRLLSNHRPHAFQIGRGSARNHGRGFLHGQPLRRPSAFPTARSKRPRTSRKLPTMCTGFTSA